MENWISNLADNLLEGIHKIKCKDCDFIPEYQSVNDISIHHKCLSWNKNYLNKIDQNFKKRLKNMFKFSNNDINKYILVLSNNDINKYILVLRKGIYGYEIFDKSEKYCKILLHENEEFYINVNMEIRLQSCKKNLKRFWNK